ncbi:MAG TPA: BON domain-containing protein [Usitatibacter sp.]|nr:BON domain-containing protein [Usitatibacter sp.]
MSARVRIPALLATAALAAVATPVLAAETIYIDTAAAYETYVPPTTYYYDTAPSVYYDAPPSTTIVYTEPPIVVRPGDDDDAALNQDVVETLALDPRLSGRIGVETHDRDVNLSGIVGTEGQALRAERDAMSVYGVSNVHNELTTRIGPHTR